MGACSYFIFGQIEPGTLILGWFCLWRLGRSAALAAEKPSVRQPFIYISAVHQEREVAGSSEGKGERQSELNLLATGPARWLEARGRLFITARHRTCGKASRADAASSSGKCFRLSVCTRSVKAATRYCAMVRSLMSL